MKNYNDFCNEQANKLFKLIDEHQGLLNWKKTWEVKGCLGLPKSVHGFYSGVNLWTLLAQQVNQGFESPIWLTFNQVKQKNGRILKGAKGQKICFFKLKNSNEMVIDAAEETCESDFKKILPLFKLYTVFNLDQTSLSGRGDSHSLIKAPIKLKELLIKLKVEISEFGNRPHYNASYDCIVMPKRDCFLNEFDYDVTLLHELVHWTGHPFRLNRVKSPELKKS